MRIKDEIVEEVRNSSSISQVIGHYIQLTKKGKNYTCLCPFHDDHDPSLSISEQKQIYKCFVCGKGGNVFNFVMDYKKVSFVEAVKEVATISGVDVDIQIDNIPKKEFRYQKEYDALDLVVKYSSYLLEKTEIGKNAKDYLYKRGIEDKYIEMFNIGYNPNQNKMYEYLKSQSIQDQIISETNICRLTDNGMKDVFAGRILFPIHDSYGNPVGFTARDFENNSDSKYINTAESPIYTKGNILYNYHRAKEECRRQNFVIVVEGVLDVIAFARADIYNVVATLGTAMTSKQFELLKSLNQNIVFAYDGDKPGQTANLKNGLFAIKNNAHVSVLDNRTLLDPDEIISKNGVNALKDLLSNRISFIDYSINYYRDNSNLANFEDRKKLHENVSSLIECIKDPDEKENYYNILFDITKIHKRISQNLTKIDDNKKLTKIKKTLLTGIEKADYNILIMISSSKEAFEIYKKELGYLNEFNCKSLALLIEDEYNKYNECNLARIYDHTDNNNIKELITTIATSEELVDEYNNELLLATIEKEKMELKKNELFELSKEIKKYQHIDKKKSDELLLRYSKLSKEINEG